MNRRDMYTGPGDARDTAYCEVVSRIIAAPATTVAASLTSVSTGAHPASFELGPLGRLSLTAPVRSSVDMSTWRARGRLHPRRPRVAQFSRIEIEISAWSDSACELTLRPTCRHIRRWSDRRWRRYFQLAEAAASALAPALTPASLVEAPAAAADRPIAAAA